MRKYQVSIVIPVYNAADYLSDCLDSILKDKNCLYEIIIVNDGSTDSSGIICKDYSVKYDQVKYIEIENSGVSTARNIGIQNATGEWIVFVDSDDMINMRMLEKASLYLSDEIDMLYCNYLKQNESLVFSEKVSKIDVDSAICYTLDYARNENNISNIFTKHNMIFTPCWGKFYRRKIIIDNNILFKPNLKFSEDMCFNLDYLNHINEIQVVDIPLYWYRVNQTSVTHSYSYAHIENRLILIDYLNKFQMKNTKLAEAKNHYIVLTTLQIAEKLPLIDNSQKEREVLKMIYDNENVHQIIYNTKKERLSVGKLQNIIYNLVLFLMKKKSIILLRLVEKAYLVTRKG